MMEYGYFDDAAGAYVITDPLTPRPWINYLGNRRLKAFISQQAGGLLWYLEPHSHRISRYHYLAAPGDQPGFHIYLKEHDTNEIWTPHQAPCEGKLDSYRCGHEPGLTTIAGERNGLLAEVTWCIPPDDDVMIWQVTVTNRGKAARSVTVSSYLEFGLLEFMREAIGWCYLKSHNRFAYDAELQAICYDHAVFEAPYNPRMVFGCSREITGFECSRDAFIGRGGSLARPGALSGTWTNSELPLGGHGCAALGTDLELAAGESETFAYIFAIGDTWDGANSLLRRYQELAAVQQGIGATRAWHRERLDRFQVVSGMPDVDRFVNCWTPANCLVTLDLARMVSTDHMGLDGLRYRDTTQDALSVAALDPEFALERLAQVLAQQTADGGGCFAFYPDNPRPTSDEPHRADNTVWQIDVVNALIAETGDADLARRTIPYRDAGEGTLFDHVWRGLRHIHERRGPHGLPIIFHADWNDGLAIFGDEKAESVMLGMQMVYACRRFAELAEFLEETEAAKWAHATIADYERVLNTSPAWDGDWYARLILSNGKVLGSAGCSEGRLYLNPQSWAVLSGVGGQDGRGAAAMAVANAQLATPYGLRVLAPPYTGIPEPTDPPLGSRPGSNENGSVFCHANTWAIIAQARLGHAEQAWELYRQLLPSSIIQRVGSDHYEREPYVYASTITGPPSELAGKGGISWLTGTASWMYVAVTQHLLGICPTLHGLRLQPCLPRRFGEVRVERQFRGCRYRITMQPGDQPRILMDGKQVTGGLLPLCRQERCSVELTY